MLERASFFLLTYFGTIVCQETGRFVHRPLDAELEGASPVRFDSLGGSLLSATGLGPFRQVGNAEHTGISLLLHGRFLSAREDGSMSVDRDEMGGWEVFLLVSEADLARLMFLLRNDWVMGQSKKIVRSAQTKVLDRFRLHLGDMEFDLRHNLPLSPLGDEWAGSSQSPAGFRTCTLWFDSWAMVELILYRPMIYYCVFGSRSLPMCASSLRSLQQLAGYTGDVLLITNLQASEIKESVFWPAGRLHILPMFGYDFMDFCTARYRIGEWEQASQFQPLLYVDTDVAFDLDPTQMLVDVVLSRKMSGQREPFMLKSHAPVGSQLFEQAHIDPGDAQGFCAGILGISSVVEHGTVLRQIVEMAYRYASFKGSRHALSHFDQAVSNFVGYVTRSLDLDVCSRYIRYVEFHDNWRGGDKPLGLAHIWGVHDKQIALDEYIESSLAPDSTALGKVG